MAALRLANTSPCSGCSGSGTVPMYIVCGEPLGAAEFRAPMDASCASEYDWASSMTTRSKVPPRATLVPLPRVLNSMCPPFTRSSTIWLAPVVYLRTMRFSSGYLALGSFLQSPNFARILSNAFFAVWNSWAV